ncbi:DNA-binding XRE family transcriptional regulator [Tumebacillus sp. BK434]|uniref:helix-turn-helix domain-containing protein n=1 Tax=Tumebacillus sp. BK434 TaxID=2512169 RepID=UPI001049D258|nr:helix-turn-helix transcriptional regulator [Tumebacillus sp. BK434]TCP58019.1 DNA-binding XRE family transcriptional regulator [Tumebacillus sp. BK434]
MAGVGQRIKELRKASKLTQQELAEGVVTRSYISQIEKGLIQPSYDTLEKLSNKLGVSVEDFFKEPENKAMLITDWKKYVRFAEGHAESGQYEQAKKIVDNLESAAQEELNDFDLGILNWVHGKLREQTNQFREAMPFYEKSLEHLTEYIDSKELVRSLDSLAYCNLQLNDNQEALRILNHANEVIIRYHLGGLVKTSVLINTGVAHAKLGEYHSAIRLLQEANYLNHAMNVHYKAGHISFILGNCHMQIGDTDAAIEFFRHAIDFYEYSDDIENKAGVITNLGILYTNTGQGSKAAAALSEAILIYEQLRDAHTKHDPAEAERLETRAVNARIELARAFLLLGETAQVQAICDRILNSSQQPYYKADALLYLGNIQFQAARFQAALDHYQDAYRLFLQSGERKKIADLEEHLGNTYFELMEFALSAQFYKKRLETLRTQPAPLVSL